MNTTGVKLKLLHAVMAGRFCVTNTNGVAGSGINKGVVIADSPSAFKEQVNELINREFTDDFINERAYIPLMYNNLSNAKKLSELW
jgi:hypothetical protein